MPVCSQCNNSFPNRAYIDGKYRNLQNRKFCLICSPFGQHNTKPSLVEPTDEEKQKKVAHKRKQMVGYVTKRRKKVMEQAVEYKGGKCQICRYDKCIRALEFHHIDPSTKEFGISDKGYTRSWDKVKAELDKCVLLCSNCHREVEDGCTKL